MHREGRETEEREEGRDERRGGVNRQVTDNDRKRREKGGTGRDMVGRDRKARQGRWVRRG